ncbi:MAG: DegT/DnrJ/EryC1/StrS aminotransferase family protein [Bacteroidales bacterium]|nr:DegT/DnrJ/EryC1/StrS aminotransferase family protein [Bacteroidales bacterium]
MIPFSPPRIDEKIINEVISALKSGWITTGPRTKLFEEHLKDYCGAKKVLCLNSATAGLELMLRWFGVKEGDEVILPAYTYTATANVVVHCGAKPVFVDVNEEDFNISLKAVEEAINEHTKVIMPVDIGGFPCDYDSIRTIINKTGIKKLFKPQGIEQEKLGRILLLSDAAHSLGAWYKGHRTGHPHLADVTVFSFHAVKNLTTAEGGAICLNLPEPFDNNDLYTHLCVKSLHGQNKDALQKTQKGNWRYDIVEAGYKFNMTDLQAAIGLIELERYDSDMLKKRAYIFSRYENAFKKYQWAKTPLTKDSHRETSYHVFMLRINGINENQRDAIIQSIFDKEVAVNVHFIPLPMMSFYKSLGYQIADFPQTYANYSCEISLPVYYNLSDEQIESVINAVINSVEASVK